VGAATSEASSRAIFRGTVPGVAPLRSSGTGRVAHCGAGPEPAPRHLCQATASDDPGRASAAAAARTVPTAKRVKCVRTPAIPATSISGTQARRKIPGRPYEPSATWTRGS
jgi:hypothetical protein